MEYFRFEVRLLDAEPTPWRQFLIKKMATFENLHHAIQDACGWENYNLLAFHERRGGSVLAGVPEAEYDPPRPDAARAKLSSFFARSGSERCSYWYDFGDDGGTRFACWTSCGFLSASTAGWSPASVRSRPRTAAASPATRTASPWPSTSRDEIDEPKELRTWLGDGHPERFDLAKVKREFDL